MTAKPLDGIVVLDLSRVLIGPFCTMTLLDLGATVIKIENPKGGDDSRAFGPFLEGQSLYFASINRGKKSVTIDLKTEAGRKLLLDLSAKADVLVENFRPGTMEKLGLGWDVLAKHNPRLIYAAASGYGHTGPYSKRPSYDILAQAVGGIMGLTGWPDMPPTRVGVSMGDLVGALFTVIGIQSALAMREKTGLGQKVDIAMLDCMVALLENALVRYQVDGTSPQPLGNRHPTITPFQAVAASDTHFVIAVGNDALWDKFCKAIGHEGLLGDARFTTNPDRTRHIAELDRLLTDIFAGKTAREWLDILETAGIPCAPINKVADLMQDPQIAARNMIVSMQDPDIGTVQIAGSPIKLSAIEDEPTRPPAPRLSQHTDEILETLLGLDGAAIATLREQGAL